MKYSEMRTIPLQLVAYIFHFVYSDPFLQERSPNELVHHLDVFVLLYVPKANIKLYYDIISTFQVTRHPKNKIC